MGLGWHRSEYPFSGFGCNDRSIHFSLMLNVIWFVGLPNNVDDTDCHYTSSPNMKLIENQRNKNHAKILFPGFDGVHCTTSFKTLKIWHFIF